MSPVRKHFRILRPVKWNRVRLLFLSLAVVITIRVSGAFWLFHILSPEGKFSTPWMDANPALIPSTLKWLWLFNAWDSLQFQIIATFGYAHPNYVFLPAYPALIRFTGLLIGDNWYGAFLVTQVFALASVVAFQRVAEIYMPPREAFYATLLMATFPYISVFTTLSYSEAVFLFLSLSTWYFYKKRRTGTASLLAALASVTRIYGIAIVLPIVFDIVRSKRYPKLLYIVIPVLFIGSWALYCYLSTGDPFISWTDEKYWTHGANGDGIRLVQAILFQGFRGLLVCCSGLDPVVFFSVSIFAYLVVRIWQVDRLLWGYAISLFGLLIVTSSSYVSLLRFISFIFPVWLTLRIRHPLGAAVCIAFFISASLLVWLYAVSVTFVG
ncbi:MAG: mannosyltransferase family protein [Candidatus Bathyarchaeia archaeon]